MPWLETPRDEVLTPSLSGYTNQDLLSGLFPVCELHWTPAERDCVGGASDVSAKRRKSLPAQGILIFKW